MLVNHATITTRTIGVITIALFLTLLVHPGLGSSALAQTPKKVDPNKVDIFGDDKPAIASISIRWNMATAAEMMKLGNSWRVTECCGWTGTWNRRPNTNIFDANWKHTNGTLATADIVELKSWNKTTNEITLYRKSNAGTYKAFLDGASIVRGTTSWYPAGATWSAGILIPVDAFLDEKGRVDFLRRRP